MDIADFLCGLAAGWSQIIVGQPFDFIKTKYQMSNALQKGNLGIKNFTKEIYSEYGLKGFYRGASSLFFGFAFIIAVEFAIYEGCKKWIKDKYYSKLPDAPEEILSIG